MTTISIIGSGNMATAIGTRAAKHGHTIREGGVLVPHVARQLIARVAQGQDLAGLLSSSRQATRMASTLGDRPLRPPPRLSPVFVRLSTAGTPAAQDCRGATAMLVSSR
jgi:hypothetical protein